MMSAKSWIASLLFGDCTGPFCKRDDTTIPGEEREIFIDDVDDDCVLQDEKELQVVRVLTADCESSDDAKTENVDEVSTRSNSRIDLESEELSTRTKSPVEELIL